MHGERGPCSIGCKREKPDSYRGVYIVSCSVCLWLAWGLTLTTADDYNSKVLSERGGAGQRVGCTKIGPRASPNRITQNHQKRENSRILVST